jgi:hypothetical protein
MESNQYPGLFEMHVTIAALPFEGLEHFREVCGMLQVKPILIELGNGQAPLQPMTASVLQGTLDEAKRAAKETAIRLTQKGFTPTRVKVEAAPENAGLPETDDDARQLPSENYFEYHLKLLLGDNQVPAIAETVAQHPGTHLSRNAFKQREDGLQERFATLRCYKMGRVSANQRFTALQDAIVQQKVMVLKAVCEYCVHDTNAALDEEWLEI